MIANLQSLNKITKKYRVTFDSGDGNAFKVPIGGKIVKFLANGEGIYLSKPDKIFFRKVSKENKRNIIKGLNNL